MKELGQLRKGDEVVIRGTIEDKRGPTVWLILDGASIGRVAQIPRDVLAEKVGTSPNYGKTSHETYRRG